MAVDVGWANPAVGLSLGIGAGATFAVVVGGTPIGPQPDAEPSGAVPLATGPGMGPGGIQPPGTLGTAAGTTGPGGLIYPQSQRRRIHIQPLSDSRDRAMGFLRLFLPHLQHKTNRTFTKLVRALPGSGHDSILSKVEVSTETGAVQSVAASGASIQAQAGRWYCRAVCVLVMVQQPVGGDYAS